jgi:hypothetical protein
MMTRNQAYITCFEYLNDICQRHDTSELIDIVGGRNVADVEFKNGYSTSEISAEQFLSWNRT